jgi:ABC-type lipoprotein release transport system permease subunit
VQSVEINNRIEVRRVQSLQGEKSFTIVLPKEFAVHLGIGKGDFLKCLVENNRLVVEKMQI